MKVHDYSQGFGLAIPKREGYRIEYDREYKMYSKRKASDMLPLRIVNDLQIAHYDYKIYTKFLEEIGITDPVPFKDDNWITHFKMMVRLYGDT
jgi:hypothetical protein